MSFYSEKVPSGEEHFETWIDQAVQAVEEWKVADTVKRQRIIESLRTPASDVVQNLYRDKPGCMITECLEALQEICRRVEDCSELVYMFSHSYQNEGEELSAYVMWLDKILHQINMKAGRKPSNTNKALLTQTPKWALPLNPIILKLRTRDQDELLMFSNLKTM